MCYGRKVHRSKDHAVQLTDRLSGRASPGNSSGPIPYLTSEEDDELVKHLLMCADIGYPNKTSSKKY